MMNLKTFLTEFTADENLAEADLDEVCCRSLEASKALRQIVERAFRLGVAEGLSSAECAIARALGVEAEEMETSGDPALQAVMQLSVRCHRAASETEFDVCEFSPAALTVRSKKRALRASGGRGPRFPKNSCRPSTSTTRRVLKS